MPKECLINNEHEYLIFQECFQLQVTNSITRVAFFFFFKLGSILISHGEKSRVTSAGLVQQINGAKDPEISMTISS